MLATVTVRARSVLNPFLDRPSQRTVGGVLRAFILVLQAIVGGAGIALRQGVSGQGSRETVSIEYSTDAARATVTCAAVVNADTVTPNGQALTAGQKRASGTVTFASAADNDTITVNGVVFTAKTSPSGDYQFLRGVSDTDDAAAFVVKVNAATLRSQDVVSAGVYNKIESKSAAAVVTLYAITEGTAGNAYTLASSNGVRLAVSGATLANGAAAANNAFDYIGSDIRTARSLATCLNASSTSAIADHVKASCRRAVVTLASVLSGDYVEIDGTRLRAVAETTDSGGNRVTTFTDDVFSQNGTDTADATSLVNCVNNHPLLRERFFATSAAGVVTLHERWPEVVAAERPTIATSNATRLAITGSATRFEDSAGVLIQSKHPGIEGNSKTIVTGNGTRLAVTNDSSGRLTGGASTTLSF